MKAYTQPPNNIVDQDDLASIRMERKGDAYLFFDAVPLELNVINMLPVEITIKASRFIDNNGLPEITISSGEEKTAKIYSKNPKFTTTSNYPVFIDWSVSDNEMAVIIR